MVICPVRSVTIGNHKSLWHRSIDFPHFLSTFPSVLHEGSALAASLGRTRSIRAGLAGQRKPVFRNRRSSPSRNTILCAASASAPVRRSEGKRSVRNAASFSARATDMNWLMLVPSSRLTSATAFLREIGSLNGQEAVCFMVQSLSLRLRESSIPARTSDRHP